MPNLLTDFINAVKGTEKEFTTGSIRRAIFFLSVPMILEMFMESLFAVVDAYFVSNFIGENGVAVVGFTESVITLVYAIAIGLSMAATAMVARRVGEKDHEGAAVAAVQAILMSGCISILLGILGCWYAPEILNLMGAAPDVIEEGVIYTRILFATNIVIMLIFMLNGIFRGAGDASIAMRTLFISNTLNIILDPCFMLGLAFFPEMGIAGAAVATSLGRGIGVAYQLSVLFRGTNILKIARRHLVIVWEIIKRMLDVGITGILQFLIASASWIFLMRFMADFGTKAVAGYTIAIRIIIFTILPAWGMANAAATLVGQNLGAGQPMRAERSVWLTARYTMIFLAIVAVIFYLSADPLIRLFLSDPTAVSEGVASLRIICLGYVFFAYGMVIGQAFNGAGDTRTPTLLNFVSFWLVQIPLAYGMAHYLNFGTHGIYWGVAISESVLAVLCVIVFRKGKWKFVKI